MKLRFPSISNASNTSTHSHPRSRNHASLPYLQSSFSRPMPQSRSHVRDRDYVMPSKQVRTPGTTNRAHQGKMTLLAQSPCLETFSASCSYRFMSGRRPLSSLKQIPAERNGELWKSTVEMACAKIIAYALVACCKPSICTEIRARGQCMYGVGSIYSSSVFLIPARNHTL